MITLPQRDADTRVLVTARGLEITFAIPWAFTGLISALVIVGMLGMFLVTVVTTEVTGMMPEILDVLEFVFGRFWLWLGLPVAVALIACDWWSNEHFILGRESVERQFRCGRIVLNRKRFPSRWVSDPDIESYREKWYVAWRWKGNQRSRRSINSAGLDEADAAEVAARIRQWLDAPDQAREDAGRTTGLALLESAIAVVSSRFGAAVPLLIGLAGLLILAQGWQLYDKPESSGSSGLDVLQVSPGRLVSLHWAFDPGSLYAATVARMRIEAEVEFSVDGQPHQLRLVGRKFEPLFWFSENYQRAARVLGTSSVNFMLPVDRFASLPSDSDWQQWSEIELGRSEEALAAHSSATELLVALDRPDLYMLTRGTLPKPDLLIAFPVGQVDKAMPLFWLEAEQAARAGMPLIRLMPVTALAILLIMLTLPGVLVRSLQRRWMARILVGLVIASLPWWAAHAEVLPRWLGIDSRLSQLTADLVRMHSPDHEHLWITSTQAPLAAGIPVAWTLEQSDSFELLNTLGLAAVMGTGRWPSEAQALEDWIALASDHFAVLSDPELKTFAIDYGSAEGPRRYGHLHWSVVEPAFCRQRPRLGSGFQYERFIDIHFQCDR